MSTLLVYSPELNRIASNLSLSVSPVAYVADQSSQPTVVDLTDLAENLLAVDVDINDELLSTVPMAMHTELPNSELQIGTEGIDDVELGIVILQSLHNVSTAEHSGEFGETIKESVDTTRAPAEFGHSLADIEMQEAVPIELPTSRGFKQDVDQVEDMEKCKNRDLMDDAAAARLSSADTLEQAVQDPTKNLGLFVYLFIFGDLINAYQSRTMSHHERAKIAIRTRLFLQTWCLYLQKAGYSEARHFISKEAFNIFEILVNGILGLIVIHRDHLGDNSCPLLPRFVASEPNEHAFAGLRDVSKDFTLQEAILIVPKLRAKMQAAVLTSLKATDFKKQASVSTPRTWSFQPVDISNAFNPGSALIAQPAPDPDFQDLYLDEDGETIDGAAVECTAAEELQRVVGSLKTASNISCAGDKELDACVMASVALAMEELAKIDDLPESDPERFAEIQKEIVHAMTTQPTAFVALLRGMAASAHSNSTVISMHHDLRQTTPIGPSGSDRAPSSRSASDRRSNGTIGAPTKHRNELPPSDTLARRHTTHSLLS
ncbi:hypothetical protein C8F04DRAFT_1258120 [Mycena alexandri]|uniref:Uncharacterized protein n=1 Tax=Mycena alexandri TaxID=1745969 RepID=A0AAD6X5H1_9AGAR|nr:hypothetical protein C8F04DRAFT_1258120 [Mycena alexandri]